MAITWTVEAAKRIRDAVRRVEGTPTGTPNPDPAANQLPPETLFALVPSGGIPARSGTTLGSAECDVYRDAPQAWGSDTRVLEQVVDGTGNAVKKFVYNTTPSDIDGSGGDRYIPITRTKHGAWIPLPGCT